MMLLPTNGSLLEVGTYEAYGANDYTSTNAEAHE
jgi:hypothetical protein